MQQPTVQDLNSFFSTDIHGCLFLVTGHEKDHTAEVVIKPQKNKQNDNTANNNQHKEGEKTYVLTDTNGNQKILSEKILREYFVQTEKGFKLKQKTFKAARISEPIVIDVQRLPSKIQWAPGDILIQYSEGRYDIIDKREFPVR